MLAVEELKKEKKRIRQLAEKLLEENAIDRQTYEEVLQRLEQEKLILGVAGQMKYGKSTLINALVFHDTVLPTADTPMTAILTKIEYGEREEYEVEFFTEEEWDILKTCAVKSNDEEEKQANWERLEAAKERLGGEIYKYFGKKVKISKKDLENYVGAEGKFTPIVKTLTVKYPCEILKELSLVDTPGFNDPIVSREKEAEKLLGEADALIFLLYAGRPIDSTDKYLIVEKIAQFGTGGLIFVLNKYDELLEDLGSLEEVEKYLNRIFENLLEEVESKSLKEILKSAPLIKLSALMALLGYLPDEKIKKDEDLSWYYEDFKEKFPFLRKKEDFLKYSGIFELDEQIKIFAQHGKINLIKQKVRGILIGKLLEKIASLRKKKLELETTLERTIKRTKSDIEKEMKELEDFINNKFYEITNFFDTKAKLREIIENYIEDLQDSARKRFNEIKFEKIGLIDLKYETKVKGKIRETIYDINDELQRKTKDLQKRLRKELRNYLNEVWDKLINDRVIFKHVKLSLKNLEELKEIIYKNLYETIDELNLKERINLSDLKIRRFIIFGASPKEAQNEANAYKEDVKVAVIKEIKKLIESNFSNNIESLLKSIRERLEEDVIKPIHNSLVQTYENYNKLKADKQNLERKIKELDFEIERLQSLKDKTERELMAM